MQHMFWKVEWMDNVSVTKDYVDVLDKTIYAKKLLMKGEMVIKHAISSF